MHFTLRFCAILAGTFLLASCRKEPFDNTGEFDRLALPAATTTGAQTLACRINGKLWTTFGKYERSAIISRAWEDNQLQVFAMRRVAGRDLVEARGQMSRVQRGTPTYEASLDLQLRALDTLGTRRVLLPRLQEALLYQSFVPNGLTYSALNRNPVRVTITRFDEAEHILSGTFEGYLFSHDATDSVHVTEGRFDFKLR